MEANECGFYLGGAYNVIFRAYSAEQVQSVSLMMETHWAIDMSHKSHNVYIAVTKWCIVGYLSDALWDLWDRSISLSSSTCQWQNNQWVAYVPNSIEYGLFNGCNVIWMFCNIDGLVQDCSISIANTPVGVGVCDFSCNMADQGFPCRQVQKVLTWFSLQWCHLSVVAYDIMGNLTVCSAACSG